MSALFWHFKSKENNCKKIVFFSILLCIVDTTRGFIIDNKNRDKKKYSWVNFGFCCKCFKPDPPLSLAICSYPPPSPPPSVILISLDHNLCLTNRLKTNSWNGSIFQILGAISFNTFALGVSVKSYHLFFCPGPTLSRWYSNLFL